MNVLKRIQYHTSQALRGAQLKLEEIKHPKTEEEFLAEIEAVCSNVTPEESAEIEKAIQKHADAEPKLNPQKTMLIQSRQGERKCNFITANAYRKKILMAHKWAIKHGITDFLADYSTPYGLLALETLVKLREAGGSFRVYAFKSIPLSKRKTYRLIPEPGPELIFLTARADYDYHDMTPIRAIRIMSHADTLCSETGIHFADRAPSLSDADIP